MPLYKRFTLSYFERLHKKNDFKKCLDMGQLLQNNKMKIVVYQRNDDNNIQRLGLITSHKVGTAVVRNKTKRLIREVFRLHKHLIKTQLDLIIILSKQTVLLDYNNIKSNFLNLLKKGGYY
ncbi:MAG: ribonuclease P protein component [Endomicrobium sp.]|jgi:ribonuclease P protein component|nr:ribonuclease P protein component [Endomicrobium sp.]